MKQFSTLHPVRMIGVLATGMASALCAAFAGELVTNSLGIELVSIPAGSFQMGGNYDGDWDERPTHHVTISRPFKISAAEITIEQFRQFRPQHPASQDGKATGVSWHDAASFCAWLSRKEGKPYRLPTEAEWEYACRVGTTNRFWSGDAPASHEAPNAWGVRGTHDAVMEWCLDWHGPYSPRDGIDPVGPVSGMTRVVRGDKPDVDDRLKDEKGRSAVDYHRSANRAGLPPAFGIGNRLPAEVAAAAVDDGNTGTNLTDRPGFHHVGFRIVQAAMPTTAPEPVELPFIRQAAIAPPPDVLKQAPAKPYFRKRHLLPIPPDNSPDEAIAAAGFPPSFRKHNHSPALEVCPNGDVLVILYTSYFEYEPGVSFMAVRLRFGADEWDFPEPMFDTPDANDHAPLLFTDWSRGGRIWFFWGWPKLRAGAFPFQWMTSDDSGATWSEVKFPQFITGIGPHSRQPINTAFRDADGTLYMASDAEKTNSVLWATSDDGMTWRDTDGRTFGRHTTFALRNDGSFLGLGGKSTSIEGYMPQAISRDGARTWAKSKTPFPAQAVNQRPSVLRLASGRLLFAADFQRRGNIAPTNSTERGGYVAWSDDDGANWRFRKLPGAQPHEKPEYSHEPPTLGYSALRQAPNGMIHLITTMNTPCLHFEFNEAWLLSGATTPASDEVLMASRATRIRRLEQFAEKFPNGSAKSRWSGGVADDGRFLKHGKIEWFHPGGRMLYEARFTLGRKTGSETFYRRDGTVAWRWQHDPDGRGIWTHYWDNGRKKSESGWRHSFAEGRAKAWDRSGRLTATVEFSRGALENAIPPNQ